MKEIVFNVSDLKFNKKNFNIFYYKGIVFQSTECNIKNAIEKIKTGKYTTISIFCKEIATVNVLKPNTTQLDEAKVQRLLRMFAKKAAIFMIIVLLAWSCATPVDLSHRSTRNGTELKRKSQHKHHRSYYSYQQAKNLKRVSK